MSRTWSWRSSPRDRPLWALHIIDWRNHEDFNRPLLIIVCALTLISVIAGIVLLPFRLRFGRQREGL